MLWGEPTFSADLTLFSGDNLEKRLSLHELFKVRFEPTLT